MRVPLCLYVYPASHTPSLCHFRLAFLCPAGTPVWKDKRQNQMHSKMQAATSLFAYSKQSAALLGLLTPQAGPLPFPRVDRVADLAVPAVLSLLVRAGSIVPGVHKSNRRMPPPTGVRTFFFSSSDPLYLLSIRRRCC